MIKVGKKDIERWGNELNQEILSLGQVLLEGHEDDDAVDISGDGIRQMRMVSLAAYSALASNPNASMIREMKKATAVSLVGYMWGLLHQKASMENPEAPKGSTLVINIKGFFDCAESMFTEMLEFSAAFAEKHPQYDNQEYNEVQSKIMAELTCFDFEDAVKEDMDVLDVIRLYFLMTKALAITNKQKQNGEIILKGIKA